MINNNLFNNEIINSKDNIHSDHKQSSFAKAIPVGASFVYELISKNDDSKKYNSHIAEHKLEKIGKEVIERKTKTGTKSIEVDKYYVDPPYIKKTVTKKKPDTKKNTENTDKKSRNAVVVKEETITVKDVEYTVKYTEQKRSKFVSISKQVKNFWSCCLVYFTNDLISIKNTLGTSDITEELIEKHGNFSKLVYIISKQINYDKVFNKSVFDKYGDKMHEKQTEYETGVSTTVSTYLSLNLELLKNSKTITTNIFVKFFYAIIQKFSMYRAIQGITISFGLFRSMMFDLYNSNCDQFNFDMQEFDKAIKSDNAKIIKTFEKTTQTLKKNNNDESNVSTSVKNTKIVEDLGEEDFDLSDDDEDDEDI